MKRRWRFRPVTNCWLIAVVYASANVLGCRATRAPIYTERSPYVSEGSIQYERPLTQNILRVVKYDRTGSADGIEKIFVTLRNLTRSALWVDIRTTFLDSDGHVLEQTNWEPTRLDPRTVTEYTSTPLGETSADFQVLIRLPKKQTFGES